MPPLPFLFSVCIQGLFRDLKCNLLVFTRINVHPQYLGWDLFCALPIMSMLPVLPHAQAWDRLTSAYVRVCEFPMDLYVASTHVLVGSLVAEVCVLCVHDLVLCLISATLVHAFIPGRQSKRVLFCMYSCVPVAP